MQAILYEYLCIIFRYEKNTFTFCITVAAYNNSLNEKVEDAMQQYDNYILQSDVKGIAGMFTTDGKLTAPGGISVRGKDSIELFLSQIDDIKIEKQKSTIDSIRKFADTAFQYGKITSVLL